MKQNKQGLALIISLLLSSLLLFVSVLVAGFAMDTLALNSDFLAQSQAFFLAESGRELGELEFNKNIYNTNNKVFTNFAGGDFDYQILVASSSFPKQCDINSLTKENWLSLGDNNSVVIALDDQVALSGTSLDIAYAPDFTQTPNKCLNWELVGQKKPDISGINGTENINSYVTCNSNNLNVKGAFGTYKVKGIAVNNAMSTSGFLIDHSANFLTLTNISGHNGNIKLCINSNGNNIKLTNPRIIGHGSFNNAEQWTEDIGASAGGAGFLPLIHWNWFQTR